MTGGDLESYLREQIPLTVAMDVRVLTSDSTMLALTAPLAPNRNHLQTAFGGSLHALATLSGYGLLWRQLDDPSAHIVIRESHIRYDSPVTGDLCAVCRTPAAPELERFRSDFARKGKARLELESTIESGGKVAVTFRGVFVAVR